MLNHHELPTVFVDHEVIDPAGEKLGRVADVVPDSRTLEPRWLVVESGHIKHTAHFVPVDGTYATEDGQIVVPYERDVVMHTAKANRDHLLTPDDERELAVHYGLN